MTRDTALRWLLANDPDAADAASTADYLRSIGCDNAVKRYKTEFASNDHRLERRDHCPACTSTQTAEARRVA